MIQHVCHLEVVVGIQVVVILSAVDIDAVIGDFPCHNAEPEAVVSSESLHLHLVSHLSVVFLQRTVGGGNTLKQQEGRITDMHSMSHTLGEESHVFSVG